jgi:hypothetical protein
MHICKMWPAPHVRQKVNKEKYVSSRKPSL